MSAVPVKWKRPEPTESIRTLVRSFVLEEAKRKKTKTVRFRFDPNSTSRQGRWRLKDPKSFRKMWTRKDPDTPGISYIVGTQKSGTFGTQAVRFEKDQWPEKEAAKWWKRNRHRFTKTWTPNDWKRLSSEGQLHETEAFEDAAHDWDEVLIDRGDKQVTRGQIRDYYLKNGAKMLPYLQGHDVLVLVGVGKNKTVLRRKLSNKNIRIDKLKGVDDPTSLEYWINRRVVEFHPVLGPQTDLVWVDLDLHDGKDLQHLRKRGRSVAKQIEAVLEQEFAGQVSTWESGKTGFHVVSYLENPVSTNVARRILRDRMQDEFGDQEDLTLGIARRGQIRLDVTTLKDTGSIRAPWSMTVTGGVKKPVKTVTAESEENWSPGVPVLRHSGRDDVKQGWEG